MLEFPKNFFKSEYISNYYVDSLMKHLWAAKLELLAKFDQVCKKYDITYYADAGTLLGAVRHRGFIPWDDDIDVCLKRPDFEKFSEIAPLEFLIFDDNMNTDPTSMVGKYLFSNIHTAKIHTHIQSTIISTNKTLFFDDNYLKMYHGYPIGVGIDIFPMDYLPKKSEKTDLIFELITKIELVQFNNEHWNSAGFPTSQEVTNYIKHIEEICNVSFDWQSPLRIQLLRLMDSLYSYFSENDSSYIVPMYWQSSFPEGNYYFKKEWYDDIVYLPFENIMVPAPKEYNKVLTTWYGDYNEPKIYENHHIQGQLNNLLSNLSISADSAIDSIKKIMSLYE